MTLTVIQNAPLYEHTISPEETTFITSYDNKDFYYRYNGHAHIIDVRNSNINYDYTNWTIVDWKGNLVQDSFMDTIIPKWIQWKAVELIDVSF